MKKNMFHTTFGTWLLLAVIFAAGCTPPPQNVNSNQNANTAANANSAESSQVATTDSTCTEANINQRRQKVYDKIKDKIEHSTLSTQYAAKTFKFDVVIPAGAGVDTLNLLLEGKVSGEGGNEQFTALTGIIKNFVHAKCTSRVLFVPPGTLPLTASTTASLGGFEWIACDYPNEPCPGGECRPPGTCPNPLDGNQNSNTQYKYKYKYKYKYELKFEVEYKREVTSCVAAPPAVVSGLRPSLFLISWVKLPQYASPYHDAIFFAFHTSALLCMCRAAKWCAACP